MKPNTFLCCAVIWEKFFCHQSNQNVRHAFFLRRIFALNGKLNQKWQEKKDYISHGDWMIESSRELINVLLFQEQLIKYKLIQCLPGQPITLWNINQNIYKHMVSNYKKKNSLLLFVKSVNKCAKNLNTNWKRHVEAESVISADSERLDESERGAGTSHPSARWGGAEPTSCWRFEFNVEKLFISCQLDVESEFANICGRFRF